VHSVLDEDISTYFTFVMKAVVKFEKTLNPKYLRLLFIVPSLFELHGGAVNEQELAKALSKKVEHMYIITFVSTFKYLTYLKEAKDFKNQLKCKLILLPNFSPPPVNSLFAIVNILVMYVNSLALMLMAVSLKKLGLVDTIYLRDPRIAIAFFSPRKIKAVTCVKFAGFYTQEMAKDMHIIISDFILDLLERVNYVVVNKADLLIVQSDLYKTALQKLYGLPRGKVLLTIPAGINLVELPQRRNHLEKRETDEHRIGYIGSAAWWNGVDILVDSMHIVQKTFPNVVLYVTIGECEPMTMKRLKEKIKKLGRRAIFLGPMSHAKALELMSTLDVLVVPRRRTLSTELTMPIKVIEAFALGIPVIITRHKVLEGEYKHGEDLLYVEPEPNDVAKKIIMLLSDRKLRERLSRRGPLIAKKFDYDIITDILIKSLENHYLKGK